MDLVLSSFSFFVRDFSVCDFLVRWCNPPILLLFFFSFSRLRLFYIFVTFGIGDMVPGFDFFFFFCMFLQLGICNLWVLIIWYFDSFLLRGILYSWFLRLIICFFLSFLFSFSLPLGISASVWVFIFFYCIVVYRYIRCVYEYLDILGELYESLKIIISFGKSVELLKLLKLVISSENNLEECAL